MQYWCSIDSRMEDFTARLNALEQGVRERDAIMQHLNAMMQQKTAV